MGRQNIRTKDFSERIFQVVEVEKQNLYTAKKKQQVDTLTGLSQMRLEQHDQRRQKYKSIRENSLGSKSAKSWLNYEISDI